jgi:hypothetical protein
MSSACFDNEIIEDNTCSIEQTERSIHVRLVAVQSNVNDDDDDCLFVCLFVEMIVRLARSFVYSSEILVLSTEKIFSILTFIDIQLSYRYLSYDLIVVVQ